MFPLNQPSRLIEPLKRAVSRLLILEKQGDYDVFECILRLAYDRIAPSHRLNELAPGRAIRKIGLKFGWFV